MLGKKSQATSFYRRNGRFQVLPDTPRSGKNAVNETDLVSVKVVPHRLRTGLWMLF